MPNDAILPALPGFTGTTAGEAYQLANAMVGAAEGFSTSLTAQAAALVAPVVNPSFPVVAAAPVPATAVQPALQAVSWNVPAQPADFVGTIGSFTLPGPFTGTPPTLIFPATPGPFNISPPTQPPVNLAFTYPTVAVTLPTPPTLLTLDVVNFNVGAVPTFNTTVPLLTAVTPTPIVYKEGALFTSALLTQAETDLMNALTYGTWTGLPAPAQQAMLDAAYEREYRANANAIAELNRMESLGYAFPPGAFNDARLKIQTETAYTVSGLSRDIFVQQTKLMLDNIVEARKLAVTLESKLIDYANEVAQRAFESAKYQTEAAIAIYNAQVQAYVASLEGYKTMAIVYDTQIKGLLAQVEIIKAEVEYEHTKAEINTQIVHQYKAEVEAALAVLEIFKTQVEIIQTQANVEKIKVELFGAEIQAFVGQINAYTAQIEAYKTSVETQGVIENVYKTQVEAYQATVQADATVINAQVEVFKSQIEAYRARLAGYDSAIRGMVGQAQAASEFNQASAAVYRGAVEAITSYNGTLTAQWQAIINEQEKIAEVGVAAAKASGDLYIAARGLSLDASKVGAQVSASLGSAALGAVHWSTSLSAAVSAANTSSDSTVESASV